MGTSSITVSVSVLTAILEHVTPDSAQREKLVRKLGLDSRRLADPDARVSILALRKLWGAAEHLTRDPLLALHVGESAQIGSFGLIDYLGAHGADVRHGLARVAWFMRLTNSLLSAQIIESGTEGRLSQGFRWDVFGLERHAAEMSFAAIVTGFRRLVPKGFSPLEVQFKHAPQGDLGEYQRVFKAPVRFGCPESTLVFDRKTLDQRLKGSDPRLGRLVEGRARALVETLPDPASLPLKISSILSEEVAKGRRPELKRVAAALKLPPRQIQRALKESRTSFSEILDQVLKTAAQRLLLAPGMNASQVGYTLGFAEPAVFTRAFKRWFKTTPGEYRKRYGVKPD